MWNEQDSHVTFQECQTKLKAAFEQAEDPKWVANFLVQLTNNAIAEMNQIPCDTCEYRYENACTEASCPYW